MSKRLSKKAEKVIKKMMEERVFKNYYIVADKAPSVTTVIVIKHIDSYLLNI